MKLTAPGDGWAGGVSKELPGEAEVGTLQGLRVMSGMWLQSLGLELRRDTGLGVISEQMVSSSEQTGGEAPGGRRVPGERGGQVRGRGAPRGSLASWRKRPRRLPAGGTGGAPRRPLQLPGEALS